MVRFKSIRVALPVKDVRQAAAFFAEFLGFRVVEEGVQRLILGHGDLRLMLMKVEPRMSPPPSPLYVQLIVDSPWQVDELAERAQRLHIPLLQERVTESTGRCSLVCLGPDDLMLEVVYEPERPTSFAPESGMAHRAEAPLPSQPSIPLSPPSPAIPTQGRDYLLLAKERLAKIKEELARLSVGFSYEDIATILDEMREKVTKRSREAAEKVAASAEQESSRHPPSRSVEETLAQYKQQVQRQFEPETPGEEERLKPVQKTLAPAPDRSSSNRRDE